LYRALVIQIVEGLSPKKVRLVRMCLEFKSSMLHVPSTPTLLMSVWKSERT